LNRADGGVDAAFSLEPEELRQLVTETERAWKSLGRVQYGPTPAEISSIQFRRSLFVVRDMKAGDEFTDNNVRIIRPGMGLAPKYLAKILGRSASIDLEKGMPIKWEYVQ
jgi:N-acetylneuraminate synthase